MKEPSRGATQRESPPSTSPSQPAHRSHLVQAAILLGLLLFVGLFAIADLRELARVFAQANLAFLLLAFVFAVASYTAMARSYQGIASAAGADVPFWEMFKITIVASAANYLLATGGLSGFALRMYFFTKRSISWGTAIIISLAQTFLTNLTLLLFVLGGFLYLFSVHTLQGSVLVLSVIILVLAVVAAVLAALLLLHPRLRRRTLFYLAQGTHWLMHRVLPHRTPPRTHIWRYQFNINRGIQFLLSRKRQMIAPSLYILLDWVFTILILYAAFHSVHHPVPLSFVIIGFAVGITLSYVTIIPGGLGIMEGSMAAIYASLGVPYEPAVVAVLIYRVAYYVLPMVISLFFHKMFRQGRAASAGMAPGDLLGSDFSTAKSPRSRAD